MSYTLLMIYGRHPMSLATEACYHYTQMDIISAPLFHIGGPFTTYLLLLSTNLFVYTLGFLGTTERFTGITGMALFWRYICLWLPSIYFHRRGDIAFSYIQGGVWTSSFSLNMVVYAAKVKKILHGSIDGRTRQRSREASHGLPTNATTIWHQLVKMGKIEKRSRCAWVEE